ncbi:MAG TPA: Rrf2 family transcriptional regulator [Novimethylophilus sp.]|jgi:Rrf2 family nitric oxide-sensitive transcriptional repressor|uniref:RrF2 family transcriptional regulator n=1 Tax=Novimethylophilus sp. TaxID=2137426 RepID=UPI002F408205
MHLTAFSDYSMRVLIYLALQRGQLATIAEIARAYGISENHLMKVVHHLAQRGYVETVRGKGGGLRLVRDPDSVNIGVLVRDTEGNASLLECLDAESSCCIQPACRLVGILREAQAALFAVLDKYTLADLLHKKEMPLTRILMVPKLQAGEQ